VVGSDLIVTDIHPLSHLHNVEAVLQWMDDLKVKHCPILKKDTFWGLISEDDALEQSNLNATLDVVFDHLPRTMVFDNDHIYDVLAKIGEFKLSVLPILNKNQQYVGCTTVHHLLQQIASSSLIQERGGVIVLEMNQHDYSMSQIAQIVESNGAKILSLSVASIPHSTKIEVTVKLNEVDIERILQTFIRFDYTIKASYQTSSLADELQYRFESLMHFLNI